jgi:hypothetical protein
MVSAQEVQMSFRSAAILSIIFLGTGLSTQPLRGQTIIGRLLDGESMQPVPAGFIQLIDSASFQVSAAFGDDEGRFTLTAPGPGEYRIRVEAFSYHSMEDGPVQVGAADTVGVEFFILPAPEELDPIVVEAERREIRLRNAGFYRRQERGLGQFITREEIEDLRVHDVPSLLAWGVRGVLLRPNGAGAMFPAFPAGRSSTSPYGGGWCFPMYFLDGLPFYVAADEAAFPIHPTNIAAVEVYATRGETPAQYRDARSRCGTVLIWSRWKETPEPN